MNTRYTIGDRLYIRLYSKFEQAGKLNTGYTPSGGFRSAFACLQKAQAKASGIARGSDPPVHWCMVTQAATRYVSIAPLRTSSSRCEWYLQISASSLNKTEWYRRYHRSLAQLEIGPHNDLSRAPYVLAEKNHTHR